MASSPLTPGVSNSKIVIAKMYLFVYNNDNTKIEDRKNPRADKGAEAEQNIGGRVYAVGRIAETGT